MDKKKILIVDDDQSILEALQMILEDEGYLVQTTTDGEFVSSLENDPPDLLLLDIWMSGIDGSVLCKSIKTNNATKNIPIVMVSANKDTEKIAKECGANGFLTKPFDITDLLQTVKKHHKTN